MSSRHHIKLGMTWLLGLQWVLFMSSATAITIADKPLYLEDNQAIEPNIMFTLDDSGSMDFTYLSASNQEPTGWRYYSATYNKLYYNPQVNYRPWINTDGTDYPLGTRACQRSGRPGNYSYSCAYYDANGSLVPIYSGDNSYPGGAKREDCATPSNCTFLEEQQNFANWYAYYRTRLQAAKAGIGRAFYELDDKVRVGYGTINSSTHNIDGISTTTLNMGIRQFTPTVKEAFFDWLYGMNADGGTPLRRAMDDVGQYYERAQGQASPWADHPGQSNFGGFKSCRQSYHILMTDGYWNSDPANTAAAKNNVDAADGNLIGNDMGGNAIKYLAVAPYKDSSSNTLADIAAYYWKRDLQPAIKNKITPSTEDPAYWQHMVNFTVSFGVDGTLSPSADTLAALTAGTLSWPTIANNEANSDIPKKVDDLWHAAINSRGGFYNAADPQAFVDALTDAFAKVQARSGSSSAIVSNTARLESNSRIYQASFNSGNWSGELTAYPLDSSSGAIGSALWSASTLIPDATERTIYTRTTSPVKTVEFLWSKLDNAQQQALNLDTNGNQDGNGALRVDWLRGDQSREVGQSNGLFRARSTLLGDIINSSPTLVSNQSYGYGDTSFTTSKADRPPMLYVGANDGMLHAFDEATGVEKFAFIPSSLIGQLPHLTAIDYPNHHRYFVDGSPKAMDAKVNNDWRTLLLGGTGAGGKAVFALDVTDPEHFSANDILWEYSSNDLGYSIPQPTLGQLAGGDWVALIPNGYNSNSQKAKLLLLNVADGSERSIMNTNAGSSSYPNGLSTPIPIDIDGDYKIDYAYAGDLLGNLWRFDLRAAQASGWTTRLIFTACHSATCSATNRQPITARPVVVAHPNGGVMVLFGTGSYFADEDRTSTQLQTMYGIWDKLEADPETITRDQLTQQTIEQETTVTANGSSLNIRIVSNNTVDYTTQRGWYLNLLSPHLTSSVGERITADIQLREDQLIFTTMLPSTDPCDFGGKSWLMELSPISGQRLSYPVFDLDGDGDIDGDDLHEGLPVSGKAFDEIITKSAFIERPGGETEIKYASGSSGTIKQTLEIVSPNAKGRQSWRQLR